MNKHYKPESIVFEGGGVLGIAYVGALKALEENNMMENIKHVAGTSAGSMAALLVALGYNSRAIHDILWNTNFEEFMDSKTGFIRDLFAVLGNKMGWNQGKKLTQWVKNVVKDATGDPETTFKTLSERSDRPYLVVPVTNLTTGRTIYFDAHSTPNMPLWLAIRASMSIPFYFQPVKLADNVLVDGGLSHNYPIDVFDHDEFISTPVDMVVTKNRHVNLRTIGFSIKTPQENQITVEGTPIRNGKDKARAVLQFMLKQANRLHVSEVDMNRTVILHIPQISWTKFNLTDAEKKSLVDAGMRYTLERLNSPLPELYNSIVGINENEPGK